MDLRAEGYDVGGWNSPVKVAPIDRIPVDQSAGAYDEIREGDLADIRVYGHIRTVRVLKLARKNATIRVTLADGREKTIVRPKFMLQRSRYAHLNTR